MARKTRHRLLGVMGGLLTGLCGSEAGGQDVPPPPPVCHGEIISRIDVHPQAPFPMGGPQIVSRLAAVTTSFHSTTKESVIRRYLTVHVGEPCTEFQRHESERILRAQPYLASATVAAYPDSSGGTVIDVTTVDEVSVILGGAAAAKAPVLRGLRLGETNLAGEALYVAGGWEHSEFYRDIYKGRVADYQFLGQPYRFSLQGTRSELGGSWDGEISYPFLTVSQPNSWRIAMGSSNGYYSFVRPGALAVSLRSERAYGDIGGVHAFGPVRQRLLIGGSFSRERERTVDAPVLILDSGIVSDTSQVLFGRYSAHEASRLNLLLGYRDVQFITVTGFDALEGAQDIRTGFQVATLLGKGIKLSAADARDYLLSGDLYAGAGGQTSFFAFETTGERRWNSDTHQWDGILGSGRTAWYFKPGLVNTLISDVEFSGGWRERVPFQLTFADREGGLPGYGASRLGGAQRVIVRLEDRRRLGHVRQFAGIAGAAFVDAGKLWAGEAPFGTGTNVKYSAGVSLFVALPPNSRRAWRFDLAQPLNDRHDAKFEIRVSNQDFTQWFWREPGDVRAVRERAIPNSVYNWP